MTRASVLLVDDRQENLLALQAILEPLGVVCVSVTSGTDALKELLLGEFACILLDVQMPGLDGFELAELIKQRERSAHIPILFVTALSQEDRHVFKGYSVGAVDYIFKPVDPDILRSKVGVFVELWQKSRQLTEQAEELHRRELSDLQRESEERYRALADAMPQIVWTADVEGGASYFNRRWFEFTGLTPEKSGPNAWHGVVHPDDLPTALARREATLPTGETFEVEYRFRARDGSYRWHLGRAVPIRDRHDRIEFWVGTATDIHDRKLIEEQRAFMIAAGDQLSRTLDYRQSLSNVAELVAARGIADWCSVHIVEDDGSITEVALAHRDPTMVTFARELRERYPADPGAATGVPAVIRRGEPELVPDIPPEMLRAAAEDDLHYDLISQLGLSSYMCAPMIGRDGVLGAVTFVSSSPGLQFGADDLKVATELARRAAMAIENTRLYREAEERAQAARVLASIGDGVLLVDRAGRVRLWNSAAERITALAEADVLGRPLADVVPGWPEGSQMGAVPIEVNGVELWLAVSAVATEDGTVYAFRDLTHERALESMRQDLVATVSHELRTPLAAIYGAALTLRREDVELEEQLKGKLLEVIAEESGRLSEIVNDLLLASQLDTGKLQANVEACDPLELAQLEVDAALIHAPDNVNLTLEAEEGLTPVAADPGQLRQVLSNLIDNAIKYSPQGGEVRVSVASHERYVRFAITDSGLGIPRDEQARIFEKFYRLDPDMKQGIGGTGLGLYICRELVRRVDGRIWVESPGSSGSTFVVEIPRDGVGRPNGSGSRTRAAAAG